MKRFLLFAGREYYPQGGWNDLIGSYDTALEADAKLLAMIREQDAFLVTDWYQVVDIEIGVIASGDRDELLKTWKTFHTN